MAVSLKMSFTLQKRDFMSNQERNVISCRIKDLPMKQKNLYQLLSLESRDVGFDEIKKAYRAKALQFHPDVVRPSSSPEECTKQFVELQKAYEVLSDPNSRRMYDDELILVESFGIGYSGHDQKGSFSRDVWELQLAGLRKRSDERMERMNNKFTQE